MALLSWWSDDLASLARQECIERCPRGYERRHAQCVKRAVVATNGALAATAAANAPPVIAVVARASLCGSSEERWLALMEARIRIAILFEVPMSEVHIDFVNVTCPAVGKHSGAFLGDLAVQCGTTFSTPRSASTAQSGLHPAERVHVSTQDWRVVAAWSQASWLAVSELVLFADEACAERLPSPQRAPTSGTPEALVASSVGMDAAFLAFDGNSSTAFVHRCEGSACALPPGMVYLEIRFDVPRVVRCAMLTWLAPRPEGPQEGRIAPLWVLQGRNDKGEWVDVTFLRGTAKPGACHDVTCGLGGVCRTAAEPPATTGRCECFPGFAGSDCGAYHGKQGTNPKFFDYVAGSTMAGSFEEFVPIASPGACGKKCLDSMSCASWSYNPWLEACRLSEWHRKCGATRAADGWGYFEAHRGELRIPHSDLPFAMDRVQRIGQAASATALAAGSSVSDAAQAAAAAVRAAGGSVADGARAAGVSAASSAIAAGEPLADVARNAADAAETAGGSPQDAQRAAGDAAAAAAVASRMAPSLMAKAVVRAVEDAGGSRQEANAIADALLGRDTTSSHPACSSGTDVHAVATVHMLLFRVVSVRLAAISDEMLRRNASRLADSLSTLLQFPVMPLAVYASGSGSLPSDLIPSQRTVGLLNIDSGSYLALGPNGQWASVSAPEPDRREHLVEVLDIGDGDIAIRSATPPRYFFCMTRLSDTAFSCDAATEPQSAGDVVGLRFRAVVWAGSRGGVALLSVDHGRLVRITNGWCGGGTTWPLTNSSTAPDPGEVFQPIDSGALEGEAETSQANKTLVVVGSDGARLGAETGILSTRAWAAVISNAGVAPLAMAGINSNGGAVGPLRFGAWVTNGGLSVPLAEITPRREANGLDSRSNSSSRVYNLTDVVSITSPPSGKLERSLHLGNGQYVSVLEVIGAGIAGVLVLGASIVFVWFLAHRIRRALSSPAPRSPTAAKRTASLSSPSGRRAWTAGAGRSSDVGMSNPSPDDPVLRGAAAACPHSFPPRIDTRSPNLDPGSPQSHVGDAFCRSSCSGFASESPSLASTWPSGFRMPPGASFGQSPEPWRRSPSMRSTSSFTSDGSRAAARAARAAEHAARQDRVREAVRSIRSTMKADRADCLSMEARRARLARWTSEWKPSRHNDRIIAEGVLGFLSDAKVHEWYLRGAGGANFPGSPVSAGTC